MPYTPKRILLFLMCYMFCAPITFGAWNFSAAVAMQQPATFTWWWFLIALPVAYLHDGLMSIIHVWWQKTENQG